MVSVLENQSISLLRSQFLNTIDNLKNVSNKNISFGFKKLVLVLKISFGFRKLVFGFRKLVLCFRKKMLSFKLENKLVVNLVKRRQLETEIFG